MASEPATAVRSILRCLCAAGGATYRSAAPTSSFIDSSFFCNGCCILMNGFASANISRYRKPTTFLCIEVTALRKAFCVANPSTGLVRNSDHSRPILVCQKLYLLYLCGRHEQLRGRDVITSRGMIFENAMTHTRTLRRRDTDVEFSGFTPTSLFGRNAKACRRSCPSSRVFNGFPVALLSVL